MKKLLLFSIIGILVASTLFGFILTVATKFALLDLFLTMAPTDKIMPKTNILLVGVDNAFGHRTDTIMVLHTDPKTKPSHLSPSPATPSPSCRTGALIKSTMLMPTAE